jgi:hypothetical protein
MRLRDLARRLCHQPRPGEPSGEHPGNGHVWRAVRAEVREVVWLMATVGALSVASVVLAVVLAGA